MQSIYKYLFSLLTITLITTVCSAQSKENKSISIKPILVNELSEEVKESSGLIYWNHLLWTHNDDKDTNLYGLNPQTGKIIQTLPLPNVTNKEWEEISQDSIAIYLADTGNNTQGNRKDLYLLRILKSQLSEANPNIETIHFSFANQTDFKPLPANTTDFDLEAFVVAKDTAYLFTKEWNSRKTTLYQLATKGSNSIAGPIATFDAEGLITGATLLENKHQLVLCGYTKLLSPFLIVFYDYKDHDFFSGKFLRIKLELPFHQIEGIATIDGTTFYLSNEKLNFKGLINNNQSLWKVDLSGVKGL